MIDIPETPPDGMVVTFYRLGDDDVEEQRYTYARNKPCHEVIGDFGKNGVPFVDEWYCEQRWIPGMSDLISAWSSNGRVSHADFRSWVSKLRGNPPYSGGIWSSFEEAKQACIQRLRDTITRHENKIKQLSATITTLDSIEQL